MNVFQKLLILASVLALAAGCATLRRATPLSDPAALAGEALAALDAGDEALALERLEQLQARIAQLEPVDPNLARLVAQARFRLAARLGLGAQAERALRQAAPEDRR